MRVLFLILTILLLSHSLPGHAATGFTQADREKLSQIEVRLDRLEATLAAHIKYTDKRFEDMNKRFDMLVHLVDKRFEDMNKRFDMIVHLMDKRFEELQKNIDKRFEAVDKRFDDINTILIIYGTLLAAIFGVLFYDKKSTREYMETLIKRFDTLEQHRKQEINAYIETYVKKIIDQVVKKEVSDIQTKTANSIP